jgi:hypothetical protein
MPSPPETDPHEAYLDAVFAKIDRIRYIDASILTERYGIDPAVLSPVDGEARPSRAVERVLAGADAQRAELREHLDALTQEYAADGMTFEAAVRKAQQALGDPAVLAEQISRSTAQAALAVDGKWMRWLRLPNLATASLLFALFPISFAIDTEHLPYIAVLATSALLFGGLSFLQGYASGITMSPSVFSLFGATEKGIKEIRMLRTVDGLTFRQRLYRLRLWRAEGVARRMYQEPVAWEGSIIPSLIFQAGCILFFPLWVAKHPDTRAAAYTSLIAIFARDHGIRLGTRRRMMRSRKRVS